MTADTSIKQKTTATSEPIRLTVVLTPELDAWLDSEAKRCMQGKSAIARLHLAEAYQRAQVETGAA